jgi:hypothetical protein
LHRDANQRESEGIKEPTSAVNNGIDEIDVIGEEGPRIDVPDQTSLIKPK